VETAVVHFLSGGSAREGKGKKVYFLRIGARRKEEGKVPRPTSLILFSGDFGRERGRFTFFLAQVEKGEDETILVKKGKEGTSIPSWRIVREEEGLLPLPLRVRRFIIGEKEEKGGRVRHYSFSSR